MASLSQYDVTHIHDIMSGPGGGMWFSAQLLRLMRKADEATLAQLAAGFPNHVALYRWWWTNRADDPAPLELVEES